MVARAARAQGSRSEIGKRQAERAIIVVGANDAPRESQSSLKLVFVESAAQDGTEVRQRLTAVGRHNAHDLVG
jgi:hypothetical protein